MASIGTLFNFYYEDVSILRTVDTKTMDAILGSFPLHVGLKLSLYDKRYEVNQIEISINATAWPHEPEEGDQRMDDTTGYYNVSCLIHIDRMVD